MIFLIISAYVTKYIDFYAIGVEEVHVGDIQKTGFKEEREVLYSARALATEEEKKLIRKKQIIKIVMLIVGVLFHIVAFMLGITLIVPF